MNLRSSKTHGNRTTFVLATILCAMFPYRAGASETVIYSQGFESGNGSFTHTGINDVWIWGTPSASSAYGPRAAHSGAKCWGTMLYDTVPFNSNAYLTSPKIFLPALGTNQVARVRFFGWIAIDYMFDKGNFQISSDGLNWETKADLFCTMLGGWNDYEFDISEYAGDTVSIRFRLTSDALNYFSPLPYNMAGFFIDDIAVTITDAPASKKILTFEGNEDQSSFASCPWLFIPGKNGVFYQENDIYSTAKGGGKAYTDYYRLNREFSATSDGKWVIKLKETDQEESFTDLFRLIIADHPANVDIACDDSGHVFTYKDNQCEAPSAAIDKNGANLLSLLSGADAIGFKAYNGDYVELNFGSMGNPSHPIFLLQAQGFVTDSTPGSSMAVQPKVEVQTQNSTGQWVTHHIFYPRWKSALCGYDLAGLFSYSKKIRLLSSSCLSGKYHLIDWAAMYTKSQSSIILTELSPDSAIRSDGVNLVTALSAVDGNSAHLAPSEEITFSFTPPSKSNDNKRNFIVKSRGYYNAMGTFFFYTWNGTNWIQRDGWTVPLSGDQTRQFDLSIWLPDPSGRNRVRIWQDFLEYSAGIDYVGLRSGVVDLTMDSATDLRDTSSILGLVNASDGVHFTWDGEDAAWPIRDRWVEVSWASDFVNTPPTTNLVFVTNTNVVTPIINWTYHDLDGNPLSQYEIEVWTGSRGTGAIVWDPPAVTGTAGSVTYAGPALSTGRQYYARVKAFDGRSWGAWSEAPFTLSAVNHLPVAEAGRDTTVYASTSCVTSMTLDGTGSYDIDGDTLRFSWTGPFGAAAGTRAGVTLPPGLAIVRLVVADGKGGSATDSVRIMVRDTVKPVADAASLPTITGQCRVAITTPPTATDKCAGKIIGVTDSLVFSKPGSYTVVWRYGDGNGNVVTQLQSVVVTDAAAPVPDSATLPTLTGTCFVTVTKYPTATDNCSGPVTGTTTAPLVYSQKGTYTIPWRYQDANGNASIQNQVVVVNDNVAPVPDLTSLPQLTGSCSVPITQYPTATDNCKGTVIATTADPLVYSTAGTYTLHWRFDDGNGNSANQLQTVTITDRTPPVPDAASLTTLQGNCFVAVTTKPTATDNCRGRIVGTTADPLFYSKKGTSTIRWTFADGNGNSCSQTQTVIVVDNTPPAPNVNPLPAITGYLQNGKCFTVGSFPTANDNCKGKIVGTTTSPLTYCYKGDYVIVWSFTDDNGNGTTQNQTVIIR